jgi:thiamine-phosphate pyrophosphorylase
MPNSRLENARLYGFVDTAYVAARDAATVAAQLIEGGADMIQVRAKKWPRPQLIDLAMRVLAVAKPRGIPVIINDDIDAAREIEADGVHLGQEDWSKIPREKRVETLSGLNIIGISTHSLEQALAAERDGASYIGIGPIFKTGTKPSAKPVGTALISEVARKISVPFFAIGGITLQNLDEVLAAGARKIAVVSAILAAPDVKLAAKSFKERLLSVS